VGHALFHDVSNPLDHLRSSISHERRRIDRVTRQLLQDLTRVRMALSQGQVSQARDLLDRLYGKTKEFTTITHLEEEGVG